MSAGVVCVYLLFFQKSCQVEYIYTSELTGFLFGCTLIVMRGLCSGIFFLSMSSPRQCTNILMPFGYNATIKIKPN